MADNYIYKQHMDGNPIHAIRIFLPMERQKITFVCAMFSDVRSSLSEKAQKDLDAFERYADDFSKTPKIDFHYGNVLERIFYLLCARFITNGAAPRVESLLNDGVILFQQQWIDRETRIATDWPAHHSAGMDGIRQRHWNIMVTIGDCPWEDRWNTATVVALANEIYNNKQWGTCPILADALEDAGCTVKRVLNQLRSKDTPWCRGNAIIDRAKYTPKQRAS